MITETTSSSLTPALHSFGLRLQTAREALGLELKEAAAQLRLNENVISMLEKDWRACDLPATFLRGYIRSYGKLLQIPDHEIKEAIEPIQPKQASPSNINLTPKKQRPLTSGSYFMQIFTYLIIFTLIGLVATWWYTHSTSSPVITSENHLAVPPMVEAPTPPLVSLPPTASIAPPAANIVKAPVEDIDDTEEASANERNTD